MIRAEIALLAASDPVDDVQWLNGHFDQLAPDTLKAAFDPPFDADQVFQEWKSEQQ